jgi:hypothetical protein
VGGTTVENGTAFDQGVIDLDRYQKLIALDNAKVHRRGHGTEALVFMKKTLGYGGHPPESMSIRAKRKKMGCGVRAEGEALVWRPLESGIRT